MSVKIGIPSYLESYTGNRKVIEVKGRTVSECLNQLAEQFPEFKKILFDQEGRLLGNLAIYVNEEDSYPEELAKAVKDGDEIQIADIIAGG